MEGASLAAKRRHEADITLAWHTAAFNGAAKTKKGLKGLDAYLGNEKPKQPQSMDDMLVTLETLRSMGAPMTIEQIN